MEDFLSNLPFQNYHRHTSYSNTSTPDSGTSNEEYLKREFLKSEVEKLEKSAHKIAQGPNVNNSEYCTLLSLQKRAEEALQSRYDNLKNTYEAFKKPDVSLEVFLERQASQEVINYCC
jgi:chromosome segregation ATPase